MRVALKEIVEMDEPKTGVGATAQGQQVGLIDQGPSTQVNGISLDKCPQFLEGRDFEGQEVR